MRGTSIRFLLPALTLFLLPFACGETPEVNKDGGSDGNVDEETICKTLFPDDCGRSCDTENTCPSGMHCRAGKCHASCGEGFECSNGGKCSDQGVCSNDIDVPTEDCGPQTCKEMGFACGLTLDRCDRVIDCADEGLACSATEMCVGGIDEPTKCVPATFLEECDVCPGIPDCSDADQLTVLRGRVVSPGRSDGDTANQVGIPNALVYILRNTDLAELPDIPKGLPSNGGLSCDRCEDQDYGPVLAGAVSDSSGYFEIEGSVPVDTDFLFVVKAGKFRRVVEMKLPKSDACTNIDLPEAVAQNPARLPRHRDDGLAVNLPHIAVATGQIDGMECVFRKMGIDADEFTAPTGDGAVHLYRANGAWPSETTSQCVSCLGASSNSSIRSNCSGCGSCSGDNNCRSCRNGVLAACDDGFEASRLTEDDGTLTDYDMAVFSCEGGGWDDDLSRDSANVREYVNRGGRVFASHLSFSWLHQDAESEGATPYDADEPLLTGLGPAASWVGGALTSPNSGPGRVSLGRDNASPRIENFTEWMIHEGVIEDEDDSFDIVDPRSQVSNSASSNGLGASSEEFVYCASGDNGCANQRAQQFSFNTPYGAPDDAICGRVAYSGFHVSAGGDGSAFARVVFPDYCEDETLGNDGVLTDQEKVLLYMLFDLGACVGDSPPGSPCVPVECPKNACGFAPNGCGGVIDCGPCGPVTK